MSMEDAEMSVTYEDMVYKRIIDGSDMDGDCLIWTRSLTSNGYGRLALVTPEGRKDIRLHRYVYEQECGSIPDGMILDHTCYNRACWNIDHLQLVTPKQNSENRDPSKEPSRGVSWRPKQRKWVARVKHNNHSYYGGAFTTEAEAAASARDLRMKLYTNNRGDMLR